MEDKDNNLIDFEDEYLEIDNNKEDQSKDKVYISKNKINLINRILHNIKEANDQLLDLMSVLGADDFNFNPRSNEPYSQDEISNNGNKVIEGIFNGEKMIGTDGKEYDIPVNYASKSKLVEGDGLKLSITSRGSFIYKQINPVERDRLVATLEQEDDLSYYARIDDQRWKLLTASVTYFKGRPSDEVIILTPRGMKSKWAAVENIIREN